MVDNILRPTTFLKKALEYEIARQMDVLESGGKVAQETRLFNTKTGETKMMRSKENAEDYRYFPDPDLIPLVLTKARISEMHAQLPELPDAKKARYMNMGLKEADAIILSDEKETADYFEEALKQKAPAQLLANWMIVELFAFLNKENLSIIESKISPTHFGELVALIANGKISGKIAKEVFETMWHEGKRAIDIIEEKGLKQISDPSAIEAVVQKVIEVNSDKVTEYRSGKDKLFGFFVGMVLKEFGGKANPEMVNEILKKML